MNAFAISALGWVATATFVASYCLARPRCTTDRPDPWRATLGALRHSDQRAPPVVVANALVIGAAAWTAFRPLTDMPRPRNQ